MNDYTYTYKNAIEVCQLHLKVAITIEETENRLTNTITPIAKGYSPHEHTPSLNYYGG